METVNNPDPRPRAAATVVERNRQALIAPTESLSPHRSAPTPGEPLLRFPWARYGAALRRYKWLVLLVIVLGIAAGFGVTRLLQPVYEVHSTLWISTDDRPDQQRAGPIRAVAPMRETSWPELLTSFAILEQVVREKSLYLRPAKPADSSLFAGFRVDEHFRPGKYTLKVDKSGWQYALLDGGGTPLQRGVLGDSIGRKVGFRWKPAAAALTPGRSVEFTVVTPREAAIGLRKDLTVTFSNESNLLGVVLKGNDPQRTTDVMSTLVDEFISAAAALKRRNVTEVAKALKQQVDFAERELRNAEAELESFRVRTIALPSEVSSPTGGGDDRQGNPVFESFFTRQVEFDATRRDRLALEGTLAAIQAGRLDASALWSVPVIGTSAPPDLRAALTELGSKQTALRDAQRSYTDDHPSVRALKQDVEELSNRTIPRLASGLVTELQRREHDLGAQLQGTEQQLRAIPVRTTEETRLRRNVEARGNLFATLKTRYEEATLAEASTVPDVSILDAPAVPESPSRSRAPFILAFAGMASIALALVLVFFLDRMDKRFRYVEQATDELGLDIIGAVPALRETNPELRDPEEASQLLEAMRTIRLNVAQAFNGDGPVLLTVSSPGIGDGKSFVSGQLATSFAEAGFRTVLVDGDLRRGEQHSRFGVERRPGLVDLLAGTARREDVLRPTSHEKLTLIPRGVMNEHAPELLMSPAMSKFIDDLRGEYDAIIVDSPPLGAGIDPYVIGTATGNLLLVLRSAQTDRKMAEAKLGLLYRLPVRLLGVVLNDTDGDGSFQYYAYLHSDLPDVTRKPRFDTAIAELTGTTASPPSGGS
jgi:capsular exopolysaccharide synthesis family protein